VKRTSRQKWAAGNERFGASGGVTPQKVLCESESLAPATPAVFPRLRQAAGRYLQPERAESAIIDGVRIRH
jgi:hypothetical protein